MNNKTSVESDGYRSDNRLEIIKAKPRGSSSLRSSDSLTAKAFLLSALLLPGAIFQKLSNMAEAGEGNSRKRVRLALEGPFQASQPVSSPPAQAPATPAPGAPSDAALVESLKGLTPQQMQAELQAKLRAETDAKLRAEAERMEAENQAKVQALLDEARAKQMAEKQTESQADGSLKHAPAANWLAASLKNADFEDPAIDDLIGRSFVSLIKAARALYCPQGPAPAADTLDEMVLAFVNNHYQEFFSAVNKWGDARGFEITL